MKPAAPVPFFRRLGVRIFSTVLVVSLATVLVSVGLLAVEARRVLQQNISQRNLHIAQHAALDTGRIVDESLVDLQAVARFLGPLPYSDWIRGTLLANVSLEFRHFSWIRLLREDGALIADSRAAAHDGNDREALDALRSAPTYVSAVQLSSDDFTPSLVVGVPLRLNDGSRGVMVAQLRLRDIWKLLDEIGIVGAGAAYVIGVDGVLLGHTDKRVLLTPEERQRIPVPPPALPVEGIVLPVETTAGTMLTAYAPVQGRQWIVAIEQPITEAFLPAEVLIRQSLLLVMVVAVISALAGILFSRRVAAPLAALVDGTRAIAAGDFGSRLRVEGPGEVEALAAAFNDMTEALEQRSRDLEASERKYRLTTEHATDLIFSLDANGRCLFASSRIRELTGSSPEEVIGRPWSEVLQFPVPSDAEPPAGATRYSVLIEATSVDGRRVPLEVSLTLGEAPNGESVWYGVARDTTERRQLEVQLYQAQKMEAVGRLAGGVAHDFNNLLTAILGYSEVAMTATDDRPRLRNAIEQIRTAGTRAASLTRQLLAFSRRQVLSPQALDLNRLLIDMEEMLRRLIGESVTLVTRLAPGLGRIHADHGQIGQVVMNLCVNARDAMPEGGRIEIETEDTPDGTIRLAIRDTGVGMTPEVKAHLYEPFFTTKGPGKGTGLGLSTVYGIVRQSGGDITCTSTPGMGTTFLVTFPRVAEAPLTVPKAPLSKPSGGNETILAVEDDGVLRSLIEGVLSDAGYTILTSGSAEEARELVERHPMVQLLITDLVLPGTSGRQLAVELRRKYPLLAVLMISGYTADTLDDYELLAGSTAFLQKPFLPADLLARIRSLLDDVSRARTGAAPAP